MAHPAPHLEAFVRAVHRRLVIVRTLERAGLGALAGCAASAALLPVLLWHGQSALVPAQALVVLGAVIGLLWGAAHRPSPLVAAMEADRQLGLRDLLGTAASVTGDVADPWSRTVVAVADQRCGSLAPSQVVLHRYGSRAWGGIALAAALVVTLAALVAPPSDTALAARDGAVALEEIGAGAISPDSSPDESFAAPQHATSSRQSPTPSDGTRTARPDEPAGAPDDTAGLREKDAAPHPGGRTRAAGTDGQGGGVGRAAKQREAAPRLVAPFSPASSDVGRQDAGAPAGGGAAAQSSVARGAEAGAAGAAASHESRGDPTPAWRSDAWAADARAAQQAVDAGRVPDAYRDLVRDYFARD